MTDIFVSYATDDRAAAGRVAGELCHDGWDVFWDRTIQPGAEWNDDIQRALRKARCVIVLWSTAATRSFWVQGEAAYAYANDTYLPVRIEEVRPPRLFEHVQAQSLSDWLRGDNNVELQNLKAAVVSRIGDLPMYGNLECVADGEPVTESHLHLIHSCWRVDKKSEFGRMPYQIHVILFGHPSALARVDAVEYQLPGYPTGHDRQRGGPRDQLFELKELANGFSIIQAHVHLKSQPPGHARVIKLSRFINMSESGPRLLDDFIRRTSAYK